MNEPIMRVAKGEEIAMMLMSQMLIGTGIYKFLAKKRIDNKYEWAHFVERMDKRKENVYRGEAKDLSELNLVLDIMNRNLVKTFGPLAEMKPGRADYSSMHGKMTPGTD
jgi:hypothetical protein